jgi:hypothetical protein
MSSNRLIYDNCAYCQKLKQSVGPNNYMMYEGKYINNHQCRMMLGQVGGNEVSLYNGNMVDLESDLLGINRPASLCNATKYHPKCKNCSQCKTSGIPCDCSACNARNLINLPNCQMVDFGPVITGPPFTGTLCHYPQSHN